jgi:hypothetical protein
LNWRTSSSLLFGDAIAIGRAISAPNVTASSVP